MLQNFVKFLKIIFNWYEIINKKKKRVALLSKLVTPLKKVAILAAKNVLLPSSLKSEASAADKKIQKLI